MAVDLTPDELHMYSRQILLPNWDLDAQLRLKAGRVLMIGAGGLGCSSAEILGRAGVGTLHIVDFDDIETSNLQRQIAFRPTDIGQSKALTLMQHIQQMNPFIEVVGIHQRFDEHFHSPDGVRYDLILDGSDNFATRYAVNRFAMTHRIPLLSAAAIGLEGQLLWLEGQPCYQCIFGTEHEQVDNRRCAESGVLASVPIMMASLQAHHALLYLGLQKKPLHHKLLLWNGMTMQQRIIHTQADPSCVCCQNLTSR